MTDRYKCILLFGAPGSGKGTQGKRLGGEDGFVHLATGDIFRSLDRGSPAGKKFVEYSSRGELVPDDLTVELWDDFVRNLVACGAYDPQGEVLLLDGIPRSLKQAEMLDERIEPLAILHLSAPNINDLVARMKARAEKEGRHDDADETVIRNRFRVYEEETTPVLGHYDPELIVDIDAIGTIDEVAKRVCDVVKPIYEGHFSSAGRA